MMKARFSIPENVCYQVKDKDGNIKPIFQENKLYLWLLKHNIRLPKIPVLFGFMGSQKIVSNLITNAGFAGMASRLNGDGAEAAFTYIAVGIGTTAAAATDTALVTEITTGGLGRAAATASRSTTDVTNDTAELTKTFASTATFAVTESGVLNAATSGTLLARQVFSAINLVSGDSLIMTWKFDID